MNINKTYIWKPGDQPYWQFCLYADDPMYHVNEPDLFKTQKECIAYCHRNYPTFPILIQKDCYGRVRKHKINKTIPALVDL